MQTNGCGERTMNILQYFSKWLYGTLPAAHAKYKLKLPTRGFKPILTNTKRVSFRNNSIKLQYTEPPEMPYLKIGDSVVHRPWKVCKILSFNVIPNFLSDVPFRGP